MLSGYLITTILLGLRAVQRPYRIFYARRLLRILPPFGLLLLLVYGGSALLHEPISKSKLIGQLLFLRSFRDTGAVLSGLRDVLSGHSQVPGLFARITRTPISRDYPYLPLTGSLGPTWSLSVEEWFLLTLGTGSSPLPAATPRGNWSHSVYDGFLPTLGDRQRLQLLHNY